MPTAPCQGCKYVYYGTTSTVMQMSFRVSDSCFVSPSVLPKSGRSCTPYIQMAKFKTQSLSSCRPLEPTHRTCASDGILSISSGVLLTDVATLMGDVCLHSKAFSTRWQAWYSATCQEESTGTYNRVSGNDSGKTSHEF